MKLTDRDLQVFAWLGEMKAMWESDLRYMLGQISGRTPSESAVRQTVLRWQKAGLARARKLFASRPRIVWLLPDGARLVGVDSWRETAEWTAYHQADTSRVRLWLTSKPNLPEGSVTEWKSERQIRSDAMTDLAEGTKGFHPADAVITFSGGTVAALEVERTPKESARLRKIIKQTAEVYDLTIYAIPVGGDVFEKQKMDALARNVATAYEDVKRLVKTDLGALQIARFPETLTED